MWAALARKARPAPVGGLTLMGILFYFLMGPLLRYHDYYELMMLPAASVWAALGWRALWGRPAARTGRWCGAMVLVVGVVVQSPLVMRGNFRLEKGYCVVAERLGRLCSGRGKIVVAGPVEGCDVVHYARREGWTLMGKPDGPAWRERFTHYQRLGAEYAVIYLNPQVPLEDRAAYQTLAESWTVVERATGNWAVGGRPVEYVIVRLEQPDSPRLTNRSVRTGNSE